MAYVVAEGLAADAVREWSIYAPNSEDRNDHLTKVYDALIQQRADTQLRADPLREAHAAIKRHIPDRSAQIDVSDNVTALLVEALDAGYLYGLAVGCAIGKVGRRNSVRQVKD